MAEEQQKPAAGGADQLAGLRSRLDEMGNLFKQWEAARSAAFRARIGVLIVILLIILGYGWAMLSTILEARKPDYQAQLMQAASRMGMQIVERARPQLQSAIQKIAPAYREELVKQFQEHKDEMYQAVLSEVEQLGNELADRVEAEFRGKLHEMAERQRQAVRNAFPSIKSDEDIDAIIENLQVALQAAAYEVLNPRIQGAQEKLRETSAKVISFLPPERAKDFQARMARMWDRVLLEDLGGRKYLEEE